MRNHANGSKEHAQALIYQFFDKAEESVNITSKGLSIYNRGTPKNPSIKN
jgi:hypothetical protein